MSLPLSIQRHVGGNVSGKLLRRSASGESRNSVQEPSFPALFAHLAVQSHSPFLVFVSCEVQLGDVARRLWCGGIRETLNWLYRFTKFTITPSRL